ncbi:beta-1,3-glucan-binding protein [Patella vulgata]|uniref:beta-1,3-glucan-binding protein n=1 Tax=Patella vulgata TaxID=6465 RepID=UPI0021802E0C|nr:beta-1,3-glucan-binding protein [Patella vulgata]
MFTLWVLLTTVGLVSCYILPDPQFSLSAKGGEFKSEDIPGLKNLYFIYKVNKGTELLRKAEKGADGIWRYVDALMENVDEVDYYSQGYLDGLIFGGSHQVWKRVPLATLPPRRMRGAVSFRDDFNGNHLDTNHWTVQVTATGEYHKEFQVYTNDHRNVYVKNGKLYIKPTLAVDSGHFTENDLYHGVLDVKKTWGTCTFSGNRGCYREAKDGLLPPLLSGRIDSKPTLKYGQVVVRAQIPRGDWIWPAIWMRPTNSPYGGWPQDGEIDFMEAACNEVAYWGKNDNHGIKRIHSTLHFGPDSAHDHHVSGEKVKEHGDWHEFHTYKMDWSPDHIIISVDDDVILKMTVADGTTLWNQYKFQGTNPWAHGNKIAPFDQQFHMILNVAIGGTYGMFNDKTHYAYPKPWHNTDKDPLKNFWEGRHNWLPTWHGDDVAMIVDYVEFRHM